MENWNPIWHQAMTRSLLDGRAFGHNKTAAFMLRSQLAGRQIRFRFSNRFGKQPYEIGEMAVIVSGKRQPVTLKGREAFRIPEGGAVSDAVSMPISVGQAMEIRIYYTNDITDCNMIEEEATLVSGNHVADGKIPMQKPFLAKLLGAYNAVPSLELVEVLSDVPSKSIVAFGDSITAMSRWTKPLALRLEKAYPGEYALLNSGISGNCLLYEPGGFFGPVFGEKGTTRFQRDVLEIPNLHTVILGLGVNDVSYYTDKTKGAINVDDYRRELAKITRTLHERGIRVAAQTISPRLGAARTMGKYTHPMEEQRLLFNKWIRGAGIFDYLLDAAAVVGETHPDGIYYGATFHQGDHLHPNAAGGRKLADAYDLERLTGRKQEC